MKKVYIDVTQAYNWTGEVTGIIRVMDEISSRCAASSSFTSVFITWEEGLGLYREVNYPEVLAYRKSHKAAAPKSAAVSNPAVAQAKRALRKTVRSIPFTKTAYKTLVSKSSKVSSYLSRNYAVRFEEGSVLFMPHGGVWESETNSRRVLEIKKEKNLKIATLMYDMCPILTPQFCAQGIRRVFKKYMKQVLPRADLVLAISDNTARDVASWLSQVSPASAPKIEVFRLGDEVAADQKPKKPAVDIPTKFTMYVGTIEARKNHTGLYYAYKLAAERGIDLPAVVLVGRQGWHTEDIYEIITKDPAMRDKFIFLHDAGDDELAWLYQNALFSVYPSFFEGWGLPVAESLLHGLPCVASSTSSIPEIAGDLVDYFSPYSPAEIMDSIRTYSEDSALLAKKAARIKSDYHATTWDESYLQIEKLLKTLV